MNSMVSKIFWLKQAETVRATFKLGCALLVVILFFLMTLPFYPLLKISRFFTIRILNRLVSFSSYLMCKVLGMKVEVKNPISLQKEFSQRNYLIISNHLSYLDIFALSSVIPSCYITSNDIKQTPMLGQICELAGCVFVERKHKGNYHQELKEISAYLQNGLSITLFPEATSTNGDAVINFKRSMFHPAFKLGVPSFNLVINVKEINGEPISRANRDLFCWYGDMDFTPHFKKLLTLQSLTVEIEFVKVIAPTDFADVPLWADESHYQISSHYRKF
jgi:1-acyl-sn-glycerol-3-phosphate acyltransferase